MRTDIHPMIMRFVDSDAGKSAGLIHSVEITPGFVTLYTKGADMTGEFVNRGTKHVAKVFHPYGSHNDWIYDEFPNQAKAGWDQHTHIATDNAAAVVGEFGDRMSPALLAAVSQGLADGYATPSVKKAVEKPAVEKKVVEKKPAAVKKPATKKAAAKKPAKKKAKR